MWSVIGRSTASGRTPVMGRKGVVAGMRGTHLRSPTPTVRAAGEDVAPRCNEKPEPTAPAHTHGIGKNIGHPHTGMRGGRRFGEL
jgi:hypothetical protein